MLDLTRPIRFTTNDAFSLKSMGIHPSSSHGGAMKLFILMTNLDTHHVMVAYREPDGSSVTGGDRVVNMDTDAAARHVQIDLMPVVYDHLRSLWHHEKYRESIVNIALVGSTGISPLDMREYLTTLWG